MHAVARDTDRPRHLWLPSERPALPGSVSGPHAGQHTRDPRMKEVPPGGGLLPQTPIPPGLHAASRTQVLNCSPLLRQKRFTRKQTFCFKCQLRRMHAPSQPDAFTKPLSEATHTTRRPQSHVGRCRRWRANDTRTGGTAHSEHSNRARPHRRDACHRVPLPPKRPDAGRGGKGATARLGVVVLRPEPSTASETKCRHSAPQGPRVQPPWPSLLKSFLSLQFPSALP